MALCLNLNDAENISAVYNALNKYGVCVDYDDEKQMKLKKRIIVGKVVHKYPVYHRNPDNMQDSDCFVIMLKKAYPEQCLSQEDRIFRFLALGDIIAYLVNIEVNTFMAIWNPKMFGTFNTNEPSFSVGPQNSVVWLIPKLTEYAMFNEIVEVDSDCGLNSSSERGNSTNENKCTAGPSHSNRCCSDSAMEEINLSENCSKENCFQAISESQPPELSQNLSLSSVDLNCNTCTEKRKIAVQKKLTEVSSQSKSCCLPAPNKKSTAEVNELTRKIPHCDCNLNKKRRNFCGKTEKCSNENSTFSVTSSSEEDSYSNIVCKNNPDFSYRNRCNCEHAERYQFKKPEAGTCCALQQNSTNNTDKRTCGYYHQQKCPCCYPWNVKNHHRNEQILHTKSLTFNSNKNFMNSPNEIKSISFPQKQGALQNTSTTDINIKSIKKQCFQNRSYLNKSNIIEDVNATKIAKDKLGDDKTVEWNLLDKVLASNNIIIKKKRKLFFADPEASDALIDVNSSIGKPKKCNSAEIKQYKVVQEIQETCDNDRIPPILPHKVSEENINKSEKDQKATFDRSSTSSFLARNKISSGDTDSNSESDSDPHGKKLFHRRLIFKRRKRCKRRSRNSETRSKDTSSTSSSEENVSFTDERSELRIVSVYTLSTDDEQFLKKYCSLGKDTSYPKLTDLTTKSHLSNFKRDSVHTVVKNNCDNKNTNCKMSKIEVLRMSEIKNTNMKGTNNANRAGNSNNGTVLDDECLNQISSGPTVLIANSSKRGNDKNTQTQSSVESSN